MNKKVLLIFVSIIIVFTGCTTSNPPIELIQFEQNTKDKEYWGIDITDTGFYVFYSDEEYITSFDIFCKSDIKIDSYDSFKQTVNYVMVYNREGKETYFWSKSGLNTFNGPSIEKIENKKKIKEVFNSRNNGLAASYNNVYQFSRIEQEKLKGWKAYKAIFDVTEGKNLPLNFYKGETAFLINDSNTVLREVYMNHGRWDYIRHVEIGLLDIEINERDPESILKAVWWAYKNKLVPFKNQLEELEIIKIQ